MFNTSKVQICQLHKSQICIGFCVSTKCPQTSIYCQRCLEEDHSDHIESCKQFGQITKDLSISIKEKKDHLDKIREKQIQLSQLNRHQIDAYEKQIKDLRNIQGQFQQKKLNSLSNQQILILKEEHQPDRQLDDLDKLNQIEQLIQSLELIKRICLTNEKQKFTKYMMNFLTKGSSWCIAIFHVIVCIMYIYLFLIGAVVMLLIYVEIDDYKQASQSQNQAYLETIQKQTQYLTQANDLYLMQNYEEAIVYYNKVINLQQDNASAYFYKGNALAKSKNFEDAIAHYNKALKINSQNDAIYLNKGYALTYLKLFEQAIECYDLALQINFHNDKAYYYKGKTLHQVEHYPEAVKSYNKAININSYNQHYYFRKGLALDKIKDYHKAISSYDSALRISINQEILKNKNNSLLNQDKFDRAQEFKNEDQLLGL